jgi:hypothetical protein
LSTGLRVVRLLTRIGTGTIGFILAVMAGAISKEAETPADIVVALAVGLSSGLLPFGVFFRWRLTRVPLYGERRSRRPDQIRRHGRSLGVALVTLGIVGLLISLLALLGLAGAPSVPPELAMIVLFVLTVSLLSGATGLGLRREASWARYLALIMGFVFFGGIPIGTFLAVDLWRFSASPLVRDYLELCSCRRVEASAG